MNTLGLGSAATSMEGQRTCQTAPNVVFESVDELKAHYKSDWHRYNLKRKARERAPAARRASTDAGCVPP